MLLAIDDPTTAISILKWVTSASGTAVAGMCVWLVYTGRLRLGREFDTLMADRDYWKAQTMRLMNSSERMLDASERTASVAEQTVSTAISMSPPVKP